MNSIQVKYSNDASKLRRGSDGNAGYDICSATDDIIMPNSCKLFKTGVSVAMPTDIYCRIAPRSGLALKHQLNVLGGVVDSNYRDDIGVILFNHGDAPYQVSKGDRIAQLVFTQLASYPVVEVDELNDTDRGTAGFGSSGI